MKRASGRFQQATCLALLVLGSWPLQYAAAQIATPTPVSTIRLTPITSTPTPTATALASSTGALTAATPAATTAATPAATPAATSKPVPQVPSPPPPSPTPVATPAPAPPAQAPPPPMNPNATALIATLRMTGQNLWPFSSAAAQALVNTLSQTLTTVTISGINVVNVTQVATKRRSRMLLGTNDTIDAMLELEGSSPQAALSINQDLGNSVFGGNLQKTLARNGLVVQSLSMVYSNAAIPEANLACNSGSYQGTCIANLNHGWSTGKIIAVAAGTGVGVLLLIILLVVCVLKCVTRKATKKAREQKPQKVMTPQYAQPYWQQNQAQVAGTRIDENGNVLMTAGQSLPNEHVETKEMGGRVARDQLKMRLPEFAGRTSRQTSGIPGISRTTSAISRSNSNAAPVSRTTSQATCIVHDN